MKRLLFILLFIFSIAKPAFALDGNIVLASLDREETRLYAWCPTNVTAGTSGGAAKTYFYQDDFDDTDGVNLYSHTADLPVATYQATGSDDSDNAEIDTGTKRTGTASLQLTNASAITCLIDIGGGYSSGKITLDFYYYAVNNTGNYNIGALGKGDLGTTANVVTYYRQSDTKFQTYRAGAYADVGTINKAAWNHIEMEFDMDNNIYDVWINGSQEGTDIAFQNSGASVEPMDIIGWHPYSGVGIFSWVDDAAGYEGARQ